MKRCHVRTSSVSSFATLLLVLLFSCQLSRDTGIGRAAASATGAASVRSPWLRNLVAAELSRGGDQRRVGAEMLEVAKARRRKKRRSRQNRGRRISSKTDTANASADSSVASSDTGTSPTSTRGDSTLPTVTSVLLPRSVSVPQLIRLLSTTILSASLCACFGTAGLPYENAVRTTLGRYPLKDNPWSWANIFAMLTNSADNVIGSNDALLPKLLPLDHFLARKTAQSKRDILPPKHLPASEPLLGCFLALLLNIGLTVLLPRWIVAFDVLLNYQRVDGNKDSLKIRQYLEDGNMNNDQDDPFYRSNLLSRPGSESDPNTGVGVLVRLPEAERIATRDKQHHAIYWLHSCDEPDATTGKEHGDGGKNRRRYYFDHSQRRIYFDPATGACTDGGPRLHLDCTVHQLVDEHAKGGLSDATTLEVAKARYDKYNSFVLPQPTIQLAFGARISSPLAVLQLLGRLLSILEDHVLSSLARLAMTLGHHFIAARRSIVASKELAEEVRANAEQVGETKVHVLRPGQGGTKGAADAQWAKKAASELLPGDVFYLQGAGPGKTLHMPVDALILDGGCVTNEAVLTGESVPQVKRPLDIVDDAQDPFDMDGDHRGSVLFAGTTLLHCDGAIATDQNQMPFPAGIDAVKCLALRTGSYSSEGEIVRSLSRSAGHYGQISNADTERDALMLIAALSGFALISCASLFVPLPGQTKSKSKSPFRTVIQMTRILMASIPSDIPLAISSIAAACTVNLRKEAEVVCSEPGSLLTSAHVDVVVLDKTGTITAETQSLTEIISPPGQQSVLSGLIDAVLAGCHSLETIEDTAAQDGFSERVIGDPVDLACLEHAGWKYHGGQNKTAYAQRKASKDDYPVQIWQLKTFPFDATRRCSSALLLVLDASGRFCLLKTVKGSPDAMRSKLSTDAADKGWYDDKVETLSARGARLITLAAKEVRPDDAIVTMIFPKGFPRLSSSKEGPGWVGTKAEATIKRAQATALKHVHRDDIEGDTLDFVDLAYFSAGLRPSTPRVIDQLQSAGIRTMMLTGDGVDAAVSIAEQAGIIKGTVPKKSKKRGKKKRCQIHPSASIAVLDIDRSGDEPGLMWKISKGNSRKRRIKHDFVMALLSTTSRIFTEVSRGDRFVACSGEAIDVVLSSGSLDSVSSFIKHKLSDVAVIARASPSTKENVVRCLKKSNTVMMTGDGTNDVNAMKLADVSAALLNGFGNEVSSSVDTEDKRRLQRILKERKKSQRSASSSSLNLHDADSATLTRQRLQAKVNAAVEQFKASSSFSGLVGDLRDIFKEERLRKSALKKGGGEAARILAREEKLRISLAEKANDAEAVLLDESDKSDEEELKPGEACLAAACTLLRPSIDGTDAIVRAGIAAAACSLTIHRSIALNALMSCFNLSTLYRDGFRYGKYMWNIESTLISAVDQFAYESACAMRPKIATVRPEASIFTSAGALSILGQAFVHLSVLYTGAELGRRLEEASESSKAKGIRVRWAGAGIADALQLSGSDDDEAGTGILGRPKFRPNQVTNAVFLLSIFQNAVISLVNHMGAPFYGKVLENRKLTLSIMASLLLAIACVSETFPDINKILQLAPFPSQKAQVTFLMLFALDLVGCYAIDRLALYFLSPERSAALKEATDSSKIESSKATTAADKHEEMLFEEEKQNKGLVLRLTLLALGFIGKTSLVGKTK